MSRLSVRLFGKLSVLREEQAVAGLDALKTQELFSYLLLHRGRPHLRETLADLLWGDSAPAQSRKYLRQALWLLQAALECPQSPLGKRLLIVEADWVRVNPQADLWLDVATLEDGHALVRGVPGDTLDAQAVRLLRGAIQLYTADLMEGWYRDWCLLERDRLRNMYLTILDKLMGYCEAQRQYGAGLEYGTHILRCDRAHERTHRRMMRLHYLGGDRTAALRQYDHCVSALREDLGVSPEKRTAALYHQMRTDQFSVLAAPAADDALLPRPPATQLAEALERLQQLQVVIVDVQRQIEQNVRAVELALHRYP